MRRPLAAATLLAVALVAGCSADTSDTAAAPANGSSVPAPAGASGAPAAGASTAAGVEDDAAPAGNTSAICAQAAKAGVDFAATFAGNVKRQIEAASAGDPSAVRQAEQEAARDVRNYSAALKDMSKLAVDPALKKALADMGERVTALEGDVSDIDEKQLSGLRTTVDQVCDSK